MKQILPKKMKQKVDIDQLQDQRKIQKLIPFPLETKIKFKMEIEMDSMPTSRWGNLNRKPWLHWPGLKSTYKHRSDQ